MIKGRAYNNDLKEDRNSALYTIHKCFRTILLLLEPLCPFISYELWTKIYENKNINSNHRKLPTIDKEYDLFLSSTQDIIKFNSEIWNKKKITISEITKKPLSLKDSIKAKIPTELEPFKEDLITMHNLVME